MSVIVLTYVKGRQTIQGQTSISAVYFFFNFGCIYIFSHLLTHNCKVV